MKIFPMIYLAFASLLSFWASTYVTEARTIAATNGPTETTLFDHVTHFEWMEGAFSSHTPPPPSVIQVEENNGESGNEMVSRAVGQSGSGDDAGRSGNPVVSDTEDDVLNDALLDDEDCGSGSMPSFGGEGTPTEDEEHTHTNQSREVCNDTSGDELRRRLWAADFFGISEGKPPRDTGDDWFKDEYSSNCSGNLTHVDYNKRATCPWTIEERIRTDRYPEIIKYTKCGRDCPHCGWPCQQVLEERNVLVRECRNQVCQYNLATEKVPVACVCVMYQDQ